MKLLLAMAFAALATSAFSQEWTTVQYDGKQLTEISRVTLNSAGKVIIIGNGGGASTTPDKLPKGFLASWGITNTAQATEQPVAAKVEDLDRAIKSGFFREIDGVVYDT